MHLPPPGTTLFDSERLEFRRFTVDDLPHIFAYHSLAEVAVYLYYAPRFEKLCRELLLHDDLRTAFHNNGDKLWIAVSDKSTT